jgi:hypothetical protein
MKEAYASGTGGETYAELIDKIQDSPNSATNLPAGIFGKTRAVKNLTDEASSARTH